MVVNLAAGVDARPYRMKLPASLKWVEVDLPDLLQYKQEILRDEKPVCSLEQVSLDLSDKAARRELFDRLGRQAKKVLILSEGLLIYLTAEEVGSLAEDLARPSSFQRWVLDLASPGLLRIIQRQLQQPLEKADAPLKFGPKEGPLFFTPHGWKPIDVRSIIKAAARIKRLSLWMRFLAMLPESSGEQGSRPWSGICLLGGNDGKGAAGPLGSIFFPLANDCCQPRWPAEYSYSRERRGGRRLRDPLADGHDIATGRTMRWTSWKSWPLFSWPAWPALRTAPRASAQIVNSSRSLGGYGAASTSSTASMGSSSTMIPYAGSFGGFMPYRMSSGGGSGLSFSTRGSSVMESSRTSFSLAPMSSGMGTGLSLAASRSGSIRSQGLRSFERGGLMSQPMGPAGNPSVMPPNFGYPFYQPPSLLSPGSSAAGMSM